MGRIPATARLGLILSAVTLLPVMIWRREPGLVLNDTLPRMRSPANAIRLIDGVPNLAWTREMTPFRAAQPAGLPWDSPDPARIATLSGVDDPWRRDLEIRRFVDIEVGLRLLPSGRRGPSEESSRLLGILDEAARAHPDNAYFPLVAAAVSRRIGDEAAAADLLRMASGLKVYDAGEKFVAAMLTAETPRRGGHGKSPSVVAQRIGDYGVVADLPHNVWVRFMLQRSGFQGDPATRLAAMKCAALARVGSTTIDRALEWATIETQIASASPTLAPALAASLPAGAKWVNKEMPRALEWRRKLEALRGMHPDWSASYLRLGLLWRQVTGLTVSCLLLFVFGLAAYVFGAPVVRGKSSPWLPPSGRAT